MAGNRDAYTDYMNAGHDAAWEQNWEAAIDHYGRAVKEFENDGDARLHLGLALLRADRLNEALREMERAQQLVPDDPSAAENAAEVLETWWGATAKPRRNTCMWPRRILCCATSTRRSSTGSAPPV
ncbi:MAG: tetratricopeptide repeat protein [Chloroflexi bacterium]|nr:tetratricopeptide repeat protein [Chloroflexota bacterium]